MKKHGGKRRGSGRKKLFSDEEFLRFYKQGLNDARVGERLSEIRGTSISPSAVRRCRHRLDLPTSKGKFPKLPDKPLTLDQQRRLYPHPPEVPPCVCGGREYDIVWTEFETLGVRMLKAKCKDNTVYNGKRIRCRWFRLYPLDKGRWSSPLTENHFAHIPSKEADSPATRKVLRNHKQRYLPSTLDGFSVLPRAEREYADP